MLYMLDTDICSYIIKKRPLAVLETMQLKVEAKNSLCISSVSYAELLLGAERSSSRPKHLKLIKEFRERLDAVLPWDDRAAEVFSKVQAQLLKKRAPIGVNDTMIAGHALSANATIVTNNQKHFSKVPKLQIDNWV